MLPQEVVGELGRAFQRRDLIREALALCREAREGGRRDLLKRAQLVLLQLRNTE